MAWFLPGEGVVGGGARVSFVPSASPFADNAARDTWAAANLADLRNSDTEVTVITVAGASFEWGGTNTPSSYNSNGWQARSILPSASQVRTLLLQNPDTDILTDAEKVEVQSLDTLPENSIPTKTSTGFQASGLTQRLDRIESDTMVTVPGATGIMFGAIRVMNGGFNIAAELVDGRQFFPLASELQTGGSGRNMWIKFGPQATTPSPANQSETFTGQSLQFKIINANDGLAEQYTFNSNLGSSISPVNIIIRVGSHTGTQIFNYAVDSGTSGFTLNDGDNAIDLPGIGLFFRAGVELYVTIDAPLGESLSLTGQTLSIGGTNETVPYVEVLGRNSEDILMLSEDSGEFESLTEKTSPVDDDIIIIEDSADSNSKKKVLFSNLPTGIAGVTVQDEGVSLTTAGTTLNFVGDGVAVTGTGATKTITISGGSPTPSPTTTDLRYGLSTASDPALVDFNALTDEANPTDPITIATGTTTAGQYFHIFSSNTHDIQTITGTVLSQIVYQDGATGNIFTKTSDVRTEGSITYDAYSIGPLNAGVDESYVLRFS